MTSDRPRTFASGPTSEPPTGNWSLAYLGGSTSSIRLHSMMQSRRMSR